MKRFWKTVGIESRDEHLTVTLDKRALKTPEGRVLLLPSHKRILATLVAAEWEHQETVIKHHALPVVRRPPESANSSLILIDLNCVSGY